MKPAAQVKCPKCQNLLRVPPDMVDISVKCKHCGNILQIKKKTTPLPSTTPQKPSLAASGNNRVQHSPIDELPEYTPPAPSARAQTARPAPIVAPMPIVEPIAEASSDYTPAFEGASTRRYGRSAYKGPKKNKDTAKWVAVGSVVVLGAGVLAAVLLKPQWFGANSADPVTPGKNTPPVANVEPVNRTQGTAPPADTPKQDMPRRMLAIAVNNYLYANSIQNGKGVDRDRHDFYKAVERLADGWRIAKSQRYYISDGPTDDGKVDSKHPPLRMVIDGSIDTFLNTSRPQDRIVIIFAGHAIEKEGEVYLVPLEGEFEEVASLMPLKDFYAKLGKCPAQEKLVIFDVCRSFPGRGVERPAFGKMTEAMEKAFHDCPDGVAVWTTCSANQNSFEDEYAELALVGLGKPRIEGSYFFSLFFPAYEKGIFGKREQGGNIQHPADPLPIAPVTAFINEKTNAVAMELQNTPQTPKLTSKARKTWLPYTVEPLAARFEMSQPPATARREEVVAMFKELDLPGIKSIRTNANSLPLADSFPFTEAQVKDFFNSGPTFDEIAKAPEKYAKEFPIRAATVEAILEMRKLKNDGMDLPESFNSPVTDAIKKEITDKYQRTVTDRQGILGELKDRLDEVAKKRDAEKSKRWQANYDFAYAQVKARLAYIFEYNLALGNVKLEKLPELDPKIHRGWTLSSVEKMTSPLEIRSLVEEAKTTFSEMATNFPNTPWAVMAKAQKNMSFGLKWEPLVKANAEIEPKSAK